MAITKQDLKDSFNEFRQWLYTDFKSELRHEFRNDFKHELKHELKHALAIHTKKIEKTIDEKVNAGVTTLKVLIEDVRSDIKFSFEAREPHEEKIQKHDKKLKEHDKKIQTLEDYVYIKDRLK